MGQGASPSVLDSEHQPDRRDRERSVVIDAVAPRRIPSEPPQAGPPPYHTFTRNGQSFAYSTAAACFWRVDETTRELLELCLTSPLEDARRALRARGRHSREQIERAEQGLREMWRRGIFAETSYTIPSEELERLLGERHRAPWTKIELALSEACNLACGYCYNSTCPDVPKQGLMSEEVAERAIDWLFEASRDEQEVGITLFGGEPLLNRRVFDFAMEHSQRRAREQGKHVRYTMTTNGTLLDQSSIDHIKRHDFGLMVSLDGPPRVQDRQRPKHGGKPSFEEASAGIRALMRRRRRVTVRCTMTNARPRMLDLIRFFEEFGFTRIVLGKAMNPTDPSPLDCDRGTLEDFARQEEEELVPWMLRKLAEGEVPKYFPYGPLIAKLHRRQGPARPGVANCGACRGTTTVGADGKLYPCHRYVGMSAFLLGHIDEGPDVERAAGFWRRYHGTMRKCDSCWARRLCERPCAWEVSNSDGTFHEPEEWKCDLVRGFHERGAYVYSRMLSDFPELLEKVAPTQGAAPASTDPAGSRPDSRPAVGRERTPR
jgi:uncharacterized protein